MKDLSLITNSSSLKFRFLTVVRPLRVLTVRTDRYPCDELDLYLNKTGKFRLISFLDCYYPIYSKNNKKTSNLNNKVPNIVEEW
jgi:hypothetical protein